MPMTTAVPRTWTGPTVNTTRAARSGRRRCQVSAAACDPLWGAGRAAIQLSSSHVDLLKLLFAACIAPGDCNFKMELLRGNLGLRQQHQKCVRRRAELSVRMNPYCSGKQAAAAVDKMFESCFADTQVGADLNDFGVEGLSTRI